MNEDELMVTDLVEEDDTMLPDGWSEGDDFFKMDSWSGTSQQADESGENDGEAAVSEDSDTQTEEDGLAMTDDSTEEQDRSADAETEEELSGQTGPTGKAPRIVKLKVNHEARDVDIDSMSDEELKDWGEKAAAYDRFKEKQAKAKYIAAFQDEVRNGMTEAHAHMVASHVTGKSFELTDEEKSDTSFAAELEDIYAAPKAAEAPKPAEPAPKQERDLAAEFAQLKAVYPDFTEMPDEVAHAVANGANALMAYVAYRGKQSEKAAASLKKENAVLKQNAAAAAKAPVKGVTGGGAAPKPKSDLLAGFDSDDW